MVALISVNGYAAVWKRLIHREDDTHERITDRLKNYRKHINAIMDEVAEHKAPPTLCFVRVGLPTVFDACHTAVNSI